MSERDIQNIIRAFADAAGRAKEAGCDAVQIHSAHGYLISAFNSPASNGRRDAWGGKLPRRMRFLETVAAAVRDEVGDDYPLFVKLGTMDFVRDGLTADEGVEIIAHLADMGLDAVEISGGIGRGNTRGRHPAARSGGLFSAHRAQGAPGDGSADHPGGRVPLPRGDGARPGRGLGGLYLALPALDPRAGSAQPPSGRAGGRDLHLVQPVPALAGRAGHLVSLSARVRARGRLDHRSRCVTQRTTEWTQSVTRAGNGEIGLALER